MEGINVALFDLTSTGKATMLDSLIGSKVAATGCGETTMAIKKYTAQYFNLWDIPGRNDEISYLRVLMSDGDKIMDIVTEYLQKAVSRRKLSSAQVIVQATLQALPSQLADIPAFPGLPGDLLQQQIHELSSCWKVLSEDS
ncbi:unnamed protein product [Rotaria socialis]|uniref:G domain-containing protein n=1 Tax=Rotaria socialis TaxID=392032 RepID=A0A821CF53_9BILA|nr:unnamed protein product [Rotaria socialis]